MRTSCIVLAAGLALVLEPFAFAQGLTERVSVDSTGAEGDFPSIEPALSFDGQIVAFASFADNLIAADLNGFEDVLVHDRTTGITEIVSVDSSGVQGNFNSYAPSISADGRFVAFESLASNLVVGDMNGTYDLFVHDRMTGVTERISVDSSGNEGNSDSRYPSISPNGQVVGFASSASNLVVGDTNGNWDVFVHDRANGITERVSVDSSGAQGNGTGDSSSLSSDGQFVAFRSDASNLVAGDTNLVTDIFVHDRVAGTTVRVSVDSGGAEGNDASNQPSISSSGQFIAFYSYATNLVANDANGVSDVFVHDRSAATTERVSVDSSGNEGNGGSYWPSISADGRIVAFFSDAANLVAGDVNGFEDVFVHDRSTGSTGLASIDSSNVQGDDNTTETAVSGDGETVAFHSFATNLVPNDTNNFVDVFVHERCSVDANWSNYGNGYPGTLGVPGLSPLSNPVLGAPLTIALDNSSGVSAVALLFIGFQQTTIPSSWGGDLVVVPFITIVIGLPPGTTPFVGDLPNDDDLCGFVLDLQAIEGDPGATKGVSFTPGLELVLGR
jgi:hypothetical protein